jgi:hypothetical protein
MQCDGSEQSCSSRYAMPDPRLINAIARLENALRNLPDVPEAEQARAEITALIIELQVEVAAEKDPADDGTA